MNKDKAIQLLERLQDPEPYEPMLTKDAYDAIQMAIDALSADGDTISRKAAIEALVAETIYTKEELKEYHEANSHRDEWVNGIYDAVEVIEQLPPANNSEIPNSSDTISRAKAIDALMDALNDVGVLDAEDINTVFQMLPPAQPEQLGTNLAEVGADCISRQAAIDALRNYLVGKNVPCDGTLTCRLIENEVISKLPSAQPKKGRWIYHIDDLFPAESTMECNQCHAKQPLTCDDEFCPNCGADMRGE